MDKHVLAYKLQLIHLETLNHLLSLSLYYVLQHVVFTVFHLSKLPLYEKSWSIYDI